MIVRVSAQEGEDGVQNALESKDHRDDNSEGSCHRV